MGKNDVDRKEPYPSDSTTVRCAEKEMGAFKKVWSTISSLTAEPTVFFFMIPFVMTALTTQNLNLEKACRVNLKMNASICDAMRIRNTSAYNVSDEAEIQKVVALAYVWKAVLHSAFPVIILSFIGSWSDRNQRRKICILTPVAGEIVTILGLLLCTYYFYELPMEVNVIAECLSIFLTGGMQVFVFGLFTFICNTSTEKTRTMRIGITHVVFQVSFTAGQALCGLVLRNLGYYGVYWLSLALYSVGIIYVMFVIKEKRCLLTDTKRNIGFCRDFFDVSHLRDTFKIVFKRGDKLQKQKVRLIITVAMLVVGPVQAEMSVMYLYTRYKFHWSEVDFGIFFSCTAILHLVATVVSVTIFTKLLKWDDALLGCIGAISKIAGSLTYAFAPNATVFYIGIGADLLSGILFVSMRSMISKQVPSEELGKMNSIFGIAEAIVPLIFGPVYSATYRATITIFPGLFYLISTTVTIPVLFIYVWLYRNRSPIIKENPEEFEKTQKLLVN